MNKIDSTMLSVPYIRGIYFNDSRSLKLIDAHIDSAKNLTDAINKANGGMFNRNIETRTLYFENILKKNIEKFDQLLILGVGLDTKYDLLPYLKNKYIFGIDIMAEEIKNIYHQANLTSIVKFIYGDINKFNDNYLTSILTNHKFDITKKTCVIWEGGSFYLHPEKIKEIMTYLIEKINVSVFCVDFLNHETFTDFNHPNKNMINNVLDILKKSGHPWNGFISKNEINNLFPTPFEISFTWHEEVELLKYDTYKLIPKLIFFTEIVIS